MSDIVETILSRIGENFDGECHLTDEEADIAAAEITRLRTFITALEDGNMTFLCDELDKAKAENASLRSLLEEAGKVVERLAYAADVYGVANLDTDDLDEEATELQDATLAARSLLDKMKEG